MEKDRALSTLIIEPADPHGREAQSCIQAYFRELHARFEQGFDPTLTVSAARGEACA